ncbi:MAG: hypothetical protein E7368_00930 [Clostridiales bacterium]|nr:hypothetical protein [Clostridiales bacterium]
MKKSNVFKKAFAGALALATLSVGFLSACGGDKTNGPATRDEQENQTHTEFIDKIGGVSDTYKGSVSTYSYGSEYEAVSAFIEEEIVGQEDATIINTTSQGELNETEVEALALPEDMKQGMSGVEKVEVEYTTNEYYSMSTAPTNGNVKIIVYVIKYHDSRWRYYSPCPVTGETITKSYFESVFNDEKYANCTMTQTLTQDMTMTQTVQGQSQTYTYRGVQTVTIKYDAGKMYLEGSVTSSGSMIDEGLVQSIDGKPLPKSQTFKVYYDDNTNKMLVQMTQNDEPYVMQGAMVNDKGWMTNLSSVITNYRLDIVDVRQITPAYDKHLDYTYFTKTNFGFEVAGENAKKYIDTALSGSMFNSFNQFGGETNTDMFAKYYVSDGVLSGTRQDLIMNSTATYAGQTMSLSTTIVAETSVMSYGTTTVVNPMEA